MGKTVSFLLALLGLPHQAHAEWSVGHDGELERYSDLVAV